MIRHIVMFRFNKTTTAAEITQIDNALKSLKRKIPGIINFHSGSNNSPEELNKGFNYAFTMDFANQKARDEYLPHPEHQAVVKQLLPKLVSTDNSILVYDIDL